MSIWFTSDCHFGHKVITKYRNQFNSITEHDSIILDQIAKLNKREILYIIGDFLFENPNYEQYLKQISKMNCRIKLVMGNHDNIDLYKQQIATNIEIQLPLFPYKNYWISHCPIHPHELRNRIGNIHGHLHHAILNDDRYFDVGLDKNDFKFVNFDQIQDTFKQRNLII